MGAEIKFSAPAFFPQASLLDREKIRALHRVIKLVVIDEAGKFYRLSILHSQLHPTVLLSWRDYRVLGYAILGATLYQLLCDPGSGFIQGDRRIHFMLHQVLDLIRLVEDRNELIAGVSHNANNRDNNNKL